MIEQSVCMECCQVAFLLFFLSHLGHWDPFLIKQCLKEKKCLTNKKERKKINQGLRIIIKGISDSFKFVLLTVGLFPFDKILKLEISWILVLVLEFFAKGDNHKVEYIHSVLCKS